MKIYISEPNEIDPVVVSKLLSDHACILGDFEFKLGEKDDCEALLIRSKTYIKKDISNHFPNLKHIIRVGVGVDNIDLAFCKENGISVYNAAGSNSNAVAEYVIATSMFALRKMHLISKSEIQKWDRFKFLGRELSSMKIGLIGFGNIAQLVYKKFKALDCSDFIIFDPKYDSSKNADSNTIFVNDLELVLSQSDIISIHVPLLDSTKNMINSQNLNLLKNESILINSSRGGIVNENDIISVKKNKQFTYIADVFENEPNINPQILEMEDVVLTPHIAAMTKEANVAMAQYAIKNFLSRKSIL